MYIGTRLKFKWFAVAAVLMMALTVGTAVFGSKWLKNQKPATKESNEVMMQLEQLSNNGDIEARNVLLKLKKDRIASSAPMAQK